MFSLTLTIAAATALSALLWTARRTQEALAGLSEIAIALPLVL